MEEWHLRKELEESCITWLSSPYFFTQEAVLKKERGSLKSQDFLYIIFNLRKFKSGWFAWNPHMPFCRRSCHGVRFSKSVSQNYQDWLTCLVKWAGFLPKALAASTKVSLTLLFFLFPQAIEKYLESHTQSSICKQAHDRQSSDEQGKPFTLFHTKEKVREGLPMLYLNRRVRDAMNRADISLEKKISSTVCPKDLYM